MKYLSLLLLLVVLSCARDRSDFVDDNATDTVALTSQDTDKTLFVWDFSEPKSYVYRAEMEMNMTMSSESDGPMGEMEMDQIIGVTYRIEAKDNGKADIYMEDIEIIKAPMPGMEDMIAEQFPQGPTLLIEDMDAGGNYDPNQTFTMTGLELMGAGSPMMLPNRDLKIGETDTIVIEQSMSQPMVDSDFKQRVFLTFAGYDEYKGKNCAVLVFDFALDETSMSIEDPSNPEGEMTDVDMDIDMETGSRYYWDPVGHYFLGGEVKMDGDVGMGSAGAMPEGMNIEMDMVQRIELVEIE